MQGTDLSQNLEIMIGSLHKVCKIGTWKFSTGRRWGWRFSQLEISQGGQMGLEILQGGSWRFPREQLEIPPGGSWRFPREQLEFPQGGQMGLEIPQRAVGDSTGGSWRFPMVAKWVGDSPGGSKEVGGSPLGAILVNVAVSTQSVV
ncbi:hypothetical protein EDD15DRAFT_2196877 [Pisolithus albus]|nr:hypothetical protein EDD15DRAFT_2196877 [Pisolithus albus]